MAGGPTAPAAGAGGGRPIGDGPGDGRLARGVRTRAIIVQAAVTLIDGGDTHPATSDVASRAEAAWRLEHP